MTFILAVVKLHNRAVKPSGAMANILHRVGIQWPAEKVYSALCEEKGFAGWWTKDVTAGREVGAIRHFRFADRGFNDMKVLELSPGKRVRWHSVNGAKEWTGTELTFDLREENGLAIVLFAQRRANAGRMDLRDGRSVDRHPHPLSLGSKRAGNYAALHAGRLPIRNRILCLLQHNAGEWMYRLKAAAEGKSHGPLFLADRLAY